nr:hypothetical protein [uncultured archaeon]
MLIFIFIKSINYQGKINKLGFNRYNRAIPGVIAKVGVLPEP